MNVQDDFLRQEILHVTENIAHHSFIIVIRKKDLVVMLRMHTGPQWQGQATGM